MSELISISPTAGTAAGSGRLVVGLRHENDALVIKLARLGRAVRGLAADLAAARRDCREKAQQIDSLKAENARLAAAASGAPDVDAPDTVVGGAEAEVLRLAARCRTHEHALARIAGALLVLRHANRTLDEENARLRRELMRCRA